MTDQTDNGGVALRDAGPAGEIVRAVRAEHDRNLKFFLEHYEELFAEHPNQFLLIYDGDKVKASPDPLELDNMRNTFDDITRCGALLEIEIPTPVIATPLFQ